MRFHDLRHATGTSLLRAGVDPHRVQRILRHTDIRVTLGTYGHLDVEDLRQAVQQHHSSDASRIAPRVGARSIRRRFASEWRTFGAGAKSGRREGADSH